MPKKKKAVPREYKPSIFCIPGFDGIIYLGADVSYRADRIDDYLTLLWHPHKPELVGVKITEVGGLVYPLGILNSRPSVPVPFKQLLQRARYHANSKNPDTVRESNLRDKFTGIAEELVGDSTIPLKVWREAMRGNKA
jgi:hypothetical protein